METSSMKKLTRFLAIGSSITGVGLVLAPTADAGNRATPQNVFVQLNADGSGFAFGAQGDARNSTGDSNQDIGCVTWLVPGAGAIGCSATDPKGKTQSCWASSSFLGFAGEIVSSLTSDSYIYFSWDTNGLCSGLQIFTNSRLQPKKFFSSAP
jgi:hypothetical protein